MAHSPPERAPNAARLSAPDFSHRSDPHPTQGPRNRLRPHRHPPGTTSLARPRARARSLAPRPRNTNFAAQPPPKLASSRRHQIEAPPRRGAPIFGDAIAVTINPVSRSASPVDSRYPASQERKRSDAFRPRRPNDHHSIPRQLHKAPRPLAQQNIPNSLAKP